MIGLETARKLKNAGLKWEPCFGDSYEWMGETWVVDKFEHRLAEILNTHKPSAIHMPSLDQLLAEIEKRDYWWEINYALMVDGGIKKYNMKIVKRHKNGIFESCIADSPEEAASLALLWILEQEAADD